MVDATDAPDLPEVTFTGEQVDHLAQALLASLDGPSDPDAVVGLLEHMGYEVYRQGPRTPTSRPRYTLAPARD